MSQQPATTILGGATTRSALKGRDFLKEIDFGVTEWLALVELAAELKVERRQPGRVPRLVGRTVALVFAAESTRTRCAFEVAAYDEGAHVTYLGPEGSSLGRDESVLDTARLLSRMYDGIVYRGFGQDTVEKFAAAVEVPVWNGLSDQWHPTQSLADVLTMIEHVDKPVDQISVAYVGDTQSNIANSLLIASATMGMDVRMVGPESLQSSPRVAAAARTIAAGTGARIRQTAQVKDGVVGADFIYTDIWLSTREPPELWDDRIELLSPYRVDSSVLMKTANPGVKFMHCLPALPEDSTELGERLRTRSGSQGLEMSNELLGSRHSIIIDQAENRLHAIKAVMVATLGDSR